MKTGAFSSVAQRKAAGAATMRPAVGLAQRSLAARAQRSVTTSAIKFPSFGGSKAKASKSSKVAAEDTAAQSFVIRIPGKLFQSNTDIVWPISLGFTKANELFVGRMAMLGFAASLLGEVLTGKGALAQFDLETGLPLFDTEPLVLALIGFNLFAALWPAKGKFVPTAEDLTSRPKGALQDPTISLATPGKFFGIEGVGFTKANELFVGRLAQLGFASSLIGEAITGQGPLAQFNIETGIPLNEAEPLLLFFIVLFGLTAVNEGTGKFVDE